MSNKKEIIEIKDFIIKSGHIIPYEGNIYVIYNQVEKDIKNDTIDVDKFKSVIYAKAHFIDKLKKSQYVQLTKFEIDFINKYYIKEFNS